MPRKVKIPARTPGQVDYVHVVKDGREYRLSLHTRAGITKIDRTFTGQAVDAIRIHERKQKGKKLSVKVWTEFFEGV